MSLSKEDSGRIGYKPDIEWHLERMYAIATGTEDQGKKYKPSDEKIDPMGLLNKYRDLNKKAEKLDGAIDALSAAEKIPIDIVRQPRVSSAAKALDSSSNGEYISYELYKNLSLQEENGAKALSLDWVLSNRTDDVHANSDLIRLRYGAGANEDSEGSEIKNDILDEIGSLAGLETYRKQILDFSNSFLINSRKSEYIPWNFKSDVRRKLVEYDDIDMFLSQYTDLTRGLSESVELIPSSPLELARDLFDAFDGKADTDNNFFDKINDVLGFNYTADLVCCLSGWASGLDLKTLKALRMILSIIGNGMSIDFGELLNGLISIINNIFKSVVGSAILGLIDEVFQLITNPIRNWLNTDDEKWKMIFLCTPIDELVNTYILGGIAYLEKMLIDKISDYLTMLEIDVHFEECKVTLMEKTKKLDMMIKIIDMIIEILGLLAYCGLEADKTRVVDEISRNIQNIEISPNWNHVYPREDNPNKYNSFTRDIVTVEQITNPDTGAQEVVERTETVFVDEISTDKIYLTKAKIDSCLNKVGDETVFSVQQWMEDLRSNSTEEINV